MFTSHARNVCLQHERKHVDASMPTARSTNIVIQNVHSFLMCRFSLSTSDILIRAGGGHFEHAVKDDETMTASCVCGCLIIR